MLTSRNITHALRAPLFFVCLILLASSSSTRAFAADSCLPGSGTFTACYYSGTTFTKLLAQRQDVRINFDWGWGSPYSGGPSDQFSVRWEGDFLFTPGTYRFSLSADDGARLYIDGQLVLDKWSGAQVGASYDVLFGVTAGTHRIKVEYFEGWGAASIKLTWQPDTGYRDFYISTAGNDSNDGRSPDTAWRTLMKVSSSTFQAGDRILLQGGQSFDGSLYFGPEDQGSALKPIVVTSYGSGRATVKPGASVGLLAYNTAGFEVRNLAFVGGAGNDKDGVEFYQNLPNNVKLPYIRIDNVETSGFGSAGINVFSWADTSGYDDVRLTNISAHDNAMAGIQIGGYLSTTLVGYAHRNVYVGDCQVYNNQGIANYLVRDTGFGIFIDSADGVTVERNVVYNNGQNTTTFAGPMGIMAMEANNVVFQYNEVHHTRTSGGDGGGLDFDGGVTNSVMQYNYTHDNDGAGINLAQYAPARVVFSNNTVRYNISQNDGRKSISWSGIVLAGAMRDTEIYNNTVYGSANANGFYKALMVVNPTNNFKIRNNVFLTAGGMEQVSISPGQIGMVLQGNCYWGSGSPLRLSWAGWTYSNLGDFRKASGQELSATGPLGIESDPKLTAPGQAPAFNDIAALSTMTAYTPLAGSPLVDSGLPLAGTNPGLRDFLGSGIPQFGVFDIGAVERTVR